MVKLLNNKSCAIMDKQGIAELNILEEIQVDGQCSQRELARRSGLAVSYLNIYLKGLVRKGYVSVRDMPGRRLWYNLTPAGITEKARMTLEYMKWSLAKYRDIRERVNVVCQELREENRLDLVICGVSDAAEIFYLGALACGLRVVGIVDDERVGETWLNIPVMKIDSLKNDITCDFIIIGDIENCFELASRLSELSIPDDRYRVCTGQRIRAVSVLEVTD